MEIKVGHVLYRNNDPNIRWEITKVTDMFITGIKFVGSSDYFKFGYTDTASARIKDVMDSGWLIDPTSEFNVLIDEYYGE